MKFLGKLIKVLGKLTDILIKGREAGFWNEQHKMKIPKEK